MRAATERRRGETAVRICVLHPTYTGSDSVFSAHDPDCDPTPYLTGHEVEHARVDRARAVRQVRRLAARGFDVFINLCDGAWDEDRAGIEVVETLESLGAAFTGAGSTFYDPARLAQEVDNAMTGPGYFAESTVVVVPAVTREAIEAAIARMARSGLADIG